MKTLTTLTVALGCFLSLNVSAQQALVTCKVENFGSLKGIQISKSNKPGISIETVESVLNTDGQIVNLAPLLRVWDSDNDYPLENCDEFGICQLNRNDYYSPPRWTIHACTEIDHEIGCVDHPVSCK